MILQLSNVSRALGAPPKTILSGVNLELAAGEYVAIMGESGVGKSTLLNIIAGLDQPTSGQIRFDGQDLSGLDDDALTLLRRKKIGFVFQAFHILPTLSVAQNAALPLLLNGVSHAQAVARSHALLADVGLGGRGDSRPSELSGGELQRVAIARALIHAPQLLLADEPTGNLDPEAATRVLELLRSLISSHGTAAILVTHSARAAATADRVLQLTPNDGLVRISPSSGALTTA